MRLLKRAQTVPPAVPLATKFAPDATLPMALHQLTDREVKTSKPSSKERLVADGGGLFLRIRPSGEKMWLLVYSFDGERRKLSLGDPADISLALARQISARHRASVSTGVDPQLTEQIRAREAAAEAERQDAQIARLKQENATLREMFEVWMSDGVQRADDNAELRRTFEKDILGSLGERPVRTITDSDLRVALRKVGRDRKRARTAERMLSELRQMFRWCIRRQPWKSLLPDGNPAELVETKQVVTPGYEAVVRERVLSPSEICELRDIFADTAAAYEAAADRRVADRPLQAESQLALWLCLGTACRIGELLKARWDDVDLKRGVWRVPKENTKTGVEWLVYLSKFSHAKFAALHRLSGTGDSKSPWCFPARNNDEHVDLKTVSKQVGDRQMRFKDRKPLKNRRNDNTLILARGRNGEWTPHDLRRTAATMMQCLGISLDVIDRCQNHVLPGSKVRRHYLHHDYAEEKRAAWDKLGDRLERILAGQDPRGRSSGVSNPASVVPTSSVAVIDQRLSAVAHATSTV